MSLFCPSLIAALDPALCVPVDNYCERIGAGLLAEPVNAFSNVAFLIAAWAAWRLHSAHPATETGGLIRALIGVVALVGLGSFLFHTVATRWAEWGDVIPILVFMLLFMWLALTFLFHLPSWLKVAALALLFVATSWLEAVVPSSVLWGGALYIPALLLLLAMGAALYRQQPAGGSTMFAATCVFLLSFTARTLDMRICPMLPLGTHFLWHILNAVFLYLLIRLAILHALPRRS